MKEYEHCSSNEQVIFNQILCSKINQIECAFGRLKARWKILLRPSDIPVRLLTNLIYSCFVLHNFCEKRNTEVDTNQIEHVILEERRNGVSRKIISRGDKTCSSTTATGVKVRDTITD